MDIAHNTRPVLNPEMQFGKLLKQEKKEKKSPPPFLLDDEVFEHKAEKEEDADADVSLSQLRSVYDTYKMNESYQQFLDQYAPLTKEYLDKYLSNDDIDPRGIQYDFKAAKFWLGKTAVDFDKEDFIIGGITYKGTPGLYELLFKTNPIGANKKDRENYRDILNRTNLYRQDNNSNKKLIAINTPK